MANITTTIAADPVRFPFVVPNTLDLAQSPIPVAEVQAVTRESAVAATGAGDNQQIDWSIALPRGYGYVLMDWFAAIEPVTVPTTNNWGDLPELDWNDSATLSPRIPLFVQRYSPRGLSSELARYYAMSTRPTAVLRPLASTEPLLSAKWYNTTANDQAYTVTVFARFLQYEVRQFDRWEVNTPQAVR